MDTYGDTYYLFICLMYYICCLYVCTRICVGVVFFSLMSVLGIVWMDQWMGGGGWVNKYQCWIHDICLVGLG